MQINVSREKRKLTRRSKKKYNLNRKEDFILTRAHYLMGNREYEE